ncbi:MAG: hypothetical protein IKA55_02780 [Akkermansia sp.]|nr:hypothetical protein [Akkermansia sp.]
MRYILPLIITFLLFSFASCSQIQMPQESRQAIIGISDDWNSSHVTLTMVEKNSTGKWQRVLGPFPGRLGRNGSVWGLGTHRNPAGATVKKEGDGRSPAGIFPLGGLWVNHPVPVQHDPSIPYVNVGPNDLWVSDPRLPHLYNRHLRLDHPATTAWEKHEQMRQNDYPHSIKLLVHHNTTESIGRPIVGAGSSIFFHIWRRNGTAPTAGCTSMDEQHLRQFISRLKASSKPVYILLPRAEYTRRRKSWGLP